MAIIQASRFAQFYRRLASLKESFTPDLQDIVMPTAELVNPFAFDLFRPRGEQLIGFNITAGPVVAQTPSVWVRPGNGTFLVPLWFLVTVLPANISFVGYASVAGAPAGTFGARAINLDTRGFGPTADVGANLDNTQINAGAVVGATTLAPPTIQNFLNLPAGFTAQMLQLGPCLTRPGTALVWSVAVANTSLNVSFVGYERAFETQENV